MAKTYAQYRQAALDKRIARLVAAGAIDASRARKLRARDLDRLIERLGDAQADLIAARRAAGIARNGRPSLRDVACHMTFLRARSQRHDDAQIDLFAAAGAAEGRAACA